MLVKQVILWQTTCWQLSGFQVPKQYFIMRKIFSLVPLACKMGKLDQIGELTKFPSTYLVDFDLAFFNIDITVLDLATSER